MLLGSSVPPRLSALIQIGGTHVDILQTDISLLHHAALSFRRHRLRCSSSATSDYHDPIGKAPERQSTICSTRKALLRKLTRALEDVLSLYRQQHQVMLGDDPKFKRFDAVIEQRAAKLKSARDAYWKYVNDHLC
jgi:hypothetical protein